eukprot:gene22297-28413_t
MLNAKSAWSVLGFEVLSIDSPSTPTQATPMNFELLGRSVVNIVSELHTSLAASLRLMHRQAMDLAGGVWKGALLVTLDEARQQATCLSLQCWKSQFSREYQIIVNISLANARHASRQSTHTLTTNLTITSSNSNSNSCVAELSLETEAYVREGVRLGDLLSDALVLVVREKIQHLALRLGRSLDDMSQALRQRFKIDVRELSIVVFRDTADVATQTMGLVIEVDVRTGKYLLSSSHAAFGSHLLADCQRDLDLFASEINNVQAEQLFAHHLTRDRSNASASVLLPAESVRTFEAVLRRLELLPWDKRLSALGGRSASVSLTALSRSVSALPSGCLVHCLGEWLSAESELRRAKGTYKAALDPCSREVVKSDSSGASSNKKRKVDQMTGGKGDIKGDLVRAEERMVHLFLLLVVGADLNSSQFMEQSICLGSWSHCEEQQQEEEQMCVFLQEAAHSAWLWARTMLINSNGRWKSVDQGGSRGEDQVWLHVPCADGVPIAAVVGSSRRVCVSFLRGGDQQVVDLCLSSGAVGPVSCLEGLVASSAAERLFSGGDATDGVRRSACELRVSLFESSAAGGKFSRQAVLETVSLGPAQTTGDTTSAADGLLTVYEELLRHGLQQVFALSDRSVDWDGLFLLIADTHLLVRLLSHVVRLRAVAAENDDVQSVRVFLRPLSHTARSNSLSFTLAVHRVEDDRSDLLVGYVELALTKPDGLLGTDEGPPATLTTVSRMLFQCRSNNFGVTDDLLACVGVGVYPHAALLNHSCTPNCVLRYSLLPSGPLLEIVALRDIGAGEELCHSYCDCTFPRALRQHNLRSTFGFDCHCELCSTSSSPHEHVLSGLRNAHDLSSRSPSPVAIRDFFRSLGHARPLLNTDVWLLESACEQNEYSDALQQAGALCREAQMIDLSSEDHISGEKEKEEKEKEEKKATRLLESAVTLMQRVCGPFHMELYQMRGMLMTSYLTAGNITDALIQCKYIVSFLCVALNHLPHHPLLGLQLFTLGDLATHCEDTQLASDAYLWASEILTVSHGPESEMFRRLVQSIRDTDKE